jgi:YHS domain-containing protein
MRTYAILFIISISSLSGQTIDYNLKKGFAAEGYDVVAYFNNEAIEGNKAFKAVFDGVNYKFSSEKNLILFNKNPEKYIPQYGGYCAYAIAVKGKKVSINPETFQIKDDKLYLFYNDWGTNTLELWKKENPGKLQVKADENWETLKTEK